MTSINWNQFQLKNPNSTEAFEQLCYFIFCRKFRQAEGILAYHNQPGIETEPIRNPKDKKWYGFQSKYFKNNIDFKQIRYSLEVIIDKKRTKQYNQLDFVEIFVNQEASKSNRSKETLDKLALKNGIKLNWIFPKQIQTILISPSYSDLAQTFFGLADEVGFINSNYKPSIINLIKSSEYIKLSFLNGGVECSYDSLLTRLQKQGKEIFFISGSPGSGKTVITQDFAWVLGGRNKKNERIAKGVWNISGIPMRINLREVFDRTLDDLIRSRKQDFKMSDSSHKMLYIFDGLDEIEQHKAEYLIGEIFKLYQLNNTTKIIVSSRVGNPNIALFLTQFSNNQVNVFRINNLTSEQKENYFKNKSINKFSEYKRLLMINLNLIESIEDALLLKLFWDNVEKLNENSTLLDLFEIKFNYLLEKPEHKKFLSQINLLDPKKESILEINKNISYQLQQKYKFVFTRKEVQDLIISNYPKLNYKEVNQVYDFLSNVYFDSYSKLGENSEAENYISYIHRRYQEYFLVKKLKDLYGNNRKVIREYNIISNSEFIKNILIPYFKKEYIKESNIILAIEMNILHMYYEYDLENNSIEEDDIIDVFKNLSEAIAHTLLYNDNSKIKELFPVNPSAIASLWKTGKTRIAKEILDEFEGIPSKSKRQIKYKNDLIWENLEHFFYIQLSISKVDAKVLFEEKVRKNYKGLREQNDMDIHETGKNKLLKSYIRATLDFNPSELAPLVQLFDKFEFVQYIEVVTSILQNNIPTLVNNENLSEATKEKIKHYKIDLRNDPISANVLFLKKLFNPSLKISTKNFNIIEEQINGIKDRDSWNEQRKNCEKYALLSYLTRPEIFSFNKEEHYFSHRNDLMLFAHLFRNYINIILKNVVSLKGITYEYIHILETEKAHSSSYLRRELSKLLGLIFANYKGESFAVAKNLVLIQNQDVIVKEIFLTTLMRHNKNLFDLYVSEQDIDQELKKLDKWNDEYPSLISMYLRLASLYATSHSEKAIQLVLRSVSESLIRHGWHKDNIASYGLVKAFLILWKNSFLPNKELQKISKELLKVLLKIFELTDGKETRNGPSSLIKGVAEYDTNNAEKLVTILIKNDLRSWANKSLTDIALIKIKQEHFFKDVEETLEKLKIDYSQSRSYRDIYEYKFKVYVKIAESDIYSESEHKIAFDKAREQVVKMKDGEFTYYLLDSNFKEEKKIYKALCKKYNVKYDLRQTDSDSSSLPDYEPKLTEKEFFEEIEKVNTKAELKKVYDILNDYENHIKVINPDTFKLLFEQTLKTYGHLNPMLEYLNKEHFTDNWYYSRNSPMHKYLIAYAINNPNTKNEVQEYLLQNSWQPGYYRLAEVFDVLKDKNMCLKIFFNYFEFVKFLIN